MEIKSINIINEEFDYEKYFSEFKKIRDILSNSEKMQDYLDYLHIQEVKKKNEKKYSLQEAKKELGL